MYMYACICMYVYVCICMCVCMCVYVCVYVCMYMCVYAYMYMYVCIIYGGIVRGEMSYPKLEGNCRGGNCPTPPNLNPRELSYTPKPKPYSGNLEPMLPVSAFEISRTAVHTVGRSSKT